MLEKDQVASLRSPLPADLQRQRDQKVAVPKYGEDVLAGLPKARIHSDPRYQPLMV